MYLAVDASPLPHHPVAFVSCHHLVDASHVTFAQLHTFKAQYVFIWCMTNQASGGLQKFSEHRSEHGMYAMLAHLDMTMYGIGPVDEQLDLMPAALEAGFGEGDQLSLVPFT